MSLDSGDTSPRASGSTDIVCTGNYSSWAEALAASTGYYLPEFVERTREATLKVKKGQAVYERDSVLFDKIQHSFQILTVLLRAALENEGCLTVIDFGGAFGTTYFQCRKLLEPIRLLRWLIVDQPLQIEHGRRDFQSDELRFFQSPKEVFSQHQPHVLLLSSVLPYMPTPYELLTELLPHSVPYVVVDRTFFLARDADRLTVQHGPHEIYPGSYPAWFLSQRRLVEKVSAGGYELLFDFDGFDSVAPVDERAFTKGFVFRHRGE
jgi:putative methyltransferase (TIGR04325 family)